jgi:hypothetical protein
MTQTTMPDVIVSEKPRLKFVVQDHSLIMDTVNNLVGEVEACTFCGAAPIVIVYRPSFDKIVTACKMHAEIVLEMIERDNG